MLKTDLSSFNNSWYNHGPLWRRLLWIVFSHIFINSYFICPVGVKVLILRLFGAKIGKGVMIKPKVNIKYPWFLCIGDNTWIGEEVWIDNLCSITIGSNVCLSQGAMLLTGNHNYTSSTFELLVENIVIEEGVWIGAKAIVCGGVTCKSHAVLTVGSVATNDLDAYCIYQGNPAVLRKKRTIIK